MYFVLIIFLILEELIIFIKIFEYLIWHFKYIFIYFEDVMYKNERRGETFSGSQRRSIAIHFYLI